MRDSRPRDTAARQRLSDEALLELVTAAQHGEPDAEHALFHEFEDLWRATIARYRRNAELYEELEGEIYLLFHHLVREFDPDRGVRLATFLGKELPLRVLSYVKHWYEVREKEMTVSTPAQPESAEEARADEEIDNLLAGRRGGEVGTHDVEQTATLRIAVRDALAALPEEQRRLVLLHVVEQYPLEEVAAMLGKSAAACRQAYKRALAKLRKELEKNL